MPAHDIMTPKVFIIVLNWNGSYDTIECVESLKKLKYPDYKILLVDNGSTDDSVVVLSKRFPDIDIIETKRNLGFAGGANFGMRRALNSGAEYVLLLNNDTVVAPDLLDGLIRAAEEDKKAGLLCSKVYFYDRPDVIWYAGGTFYPWLGWGRHRGYNLRDNGRFDRVEETGRPCGCSIMATREFCEKAGLLDEEYFCYCEDLDWGMRAEKLGFKVLYVPHSKVWHKVSKATEGSRMTIPLYYSIRNTLRCVDKNNPLPFILRHIRYLTIAIACLLSLFTMKIPKVSGAKRIYEGIRDYFQERFGEFVGRGDL